MLSTLCSAQDAPPPPHAITRPRIVIVPKQGAGLSQVPQRKRPAATSRPPPTSFYIRFLEMTEGYKRQKVANEIREGSREGLAEKRARLGPSSVYHILGTRPAAAWAPPIFPCPTSRTLLGHS